MARAEAATVMALALLFLTAGRTPQGAAAVAAMEGGREGAADEDGCIMAGARLMLRAPHTKQGAAAMEGGCEGAADEDRCIMAGARRMLRAPHTKQGAAAMEGGCEGAADEDECMARQTLDTLSDDVYTDPQYNHVGGPSTKPESRN